ncbi:hypothetical protein Gotur_004770, partial [Gossypium turneri]
VWSSITVDKKLFEGSGFLAKSVSSLWRTCSYNWDCLWMSPYSPDNIYGCQNEMGWLDSTEVERIRYARAYIFEMIGGYLMLDLSRNLIHLRWLLKLVNFRAVGELS